MPHLHVPHAASVGTPPAGTSIVYAGVGGELRTKQSDGSDFRVGSGVTPRRIPAGMSFLVPEYHQLVVQGTFLLEGTIVLDGDLVIL